MNENQTSNQMNFNEQESDAIRRGVLAAAALVSQADPGFLDSFRESFAASKAMQQAPAELQKVMQGGLVAPPQASSKEDLHNKLLQQAQEALHIGDQKGGQTGQAVRSLMQAVTSNVAQAAKGVSQGEQAVIDQIMTVSGGTAGLPDPQQQTQFEQPQFGTQQGQFQQPQFGTQQGQFQQPQFGTQQGQFQQPTFGQDGQTQR